MSEIDLRYYSAALDEIYRLRTILALEARVLEAHTELATFPKSRRRFAEGSIERMRAAARGDVRGSSLAGESRWSLEQVRDAVGMDKLPRAAWEEHVDGLERWAGRV